MGGRAGGKSPPRGSWRPGLLSPWTGSGAQPGAWGLQRAAPIPVPGTAVPCAAGCSLFTPAGTRCPMLWVPRWGLSGDTTSLPGSPCAGPRVLASPKGAAGSCLPSCAWLNLNRAGLLHQSLPAGDKDQQDPSGTVLGSCCGVGRGMWGSGGMRLGWTRGLSSRPGPHSVELGPDVPHHCPLCVASSSEVAPGKAGAGPGPTRAPCPAGLIRGCGLWPGL